MHDENDHGFAEASNSILESEVTLKADQSSSFLKEEKENSLIQDTSKTLLEPDNLLNDNSGE